MNSIFLHWFSIHLVIFAIVYARFVHGINQVRNIKELRDFRKNLYKNKDSFQKISSFIFHQNKPTLMSTAIPVTFGLMVSHLISFVRCLAKDLDNAANMFLLLAGSVFSSVEKNIHLCFQRSTHWCSHCLLKSFIAFFSSQEYSVMEALFLTTYIKKWKPRKPPKIPTL